MMPTTSAMSNASCWSWVTRTAVVFWQLEDFTHFAAEGVRAINIEIRERLVQQQSVPGAAPARAPARRVVAGRPTVHAGNRSSRRPDRRYPAIRGRAVPRSLAASPAIRNAMFAATVEMREQGIVLEHHANAALFRRHAEASICNGDSIDGFHPAIVLESGDTAQRVVLPQPACPAGSRCYRLRR